VESKHWCGTAAHGCEPTLSTFYAIKLHLSFVAVAFALPITCDHVAMSRDHGDVGDYYILDPTVNMQLRG
jgi:hypothetical protein